ncbi:phosphate uptake regulator PhoU [Candidatus Woesearchaeota archaeon]|nr:phosphate uptake regulator PhoU [Candidatus Woesearchaeota archaeon]
MKRSIVQHGSSSLTITLPVKWVEQYGLKKGDELEVEEAGSHLIVATQKATAATKKHITADQGVFTKNNLSHLYQLGYDEVEIQYRDAKTLDEIKQRLPDCIGFEIIDQKENWVLIKSIATTLDSEFDTLLRKAFQITNEMAKSIVSALERHEYAKLKDIRSMESLNNKFTDVCTRILNKRGYKVPHRTMQMYEIVKNIERIADEFKHLCDLTYPARQDKAVLDATKKVCDYYMTFSMMFYAFDPALKEKLYVQRKVLMQSCTKLIDKNPLLIHHLLNIVEKTYDGAGGYFALML